MPISGDFMVLLTQRIFKSLVFIFSLLSLAAILSPASAQEQEEQEEGDTGLFEELVVTAQKREENIGDVPVAVSVLDADQIEATFANGLEELQDFVPSVSFRTGNTTRNSALTVRGIGTISFSTAAEPSVSTVVDNVVLGRSGQAFGDLYDLEQVEVLRGPQGTLFGKNASAGVVNLTTKKPSDEFEGYVDLSFFQDNEQRFKARVSGPLRDNVRGSVTVFDGSFDGFVTNVFNNERIQGYDKQGIRAMLDVDINAITSALVIFEDYDAENDCCTDIEALPSGRNPLSEAAPTINADGSPDLDLRLVDHDFETITLDASTSFSVQFDWQLGDYTLTSITAQRQWDNTEIREGDFTSIAGDSMDPVFGAPFQLHDVGPQEWSQFSQELRLSSPSDRAFVWQVGAFFFDIDSERSFTREASCQNNAGQLALNIANHIEQTLGMPLPDDVDAAQQVVDDFIAAEGITCNANDIIAGTASFDTEFNNFALFGQGSIQLNDYIGITLGLRFTEDEVSFNHNRLNGDEFGRRGVGVRPRFAEVDSVLGQALFSGEQGDGIAAIDEFDTNFDGETDATDLSGKIGFDWKPNDTNLFYATYATGYKGPAFNVFFNQDFTDIDPIEEETSESFEIGYKYTGNRFFAAVALYDTRINDFQANDFDASDGVTITGFTNGGDVETTGVEIDFLWQATEAFSLSGGLSSLDAETVVTGDPLPFAVEFKYSVVGDYYWPLGNDAAISLNGSYVFTDEKLSGNIGQTGETNPEILLPDYAILNATVSYIAPEDQYRISLIGKNLTDETFATTNSGDGFRFQIPRLADRFFGLNFRYNF